MIEKGTRLYPQRISSTQMYYEDEPYAYWVSESSINFYNWILYKKYNNYVSICSPNDCLSALSYEDVIEELRTYSFYDRMDREKLCKAFKQRSLHMSSEERNNFKDFENI